MTARYRGPRPGMVGMGYVGMATAAAFAHYGIPTVGYDVDAERIASLRGGRVPVYEEGLAPLVQKQVRAGRLSFEDSMEELVRSCHVIFLSVQTPSTADGSIDLSFLSQAAMDVGMALRKVKSWRLVVVKSTVVPGTAEGLVARVLASASGRAAGKGFAVASNPEFLAEGTMVKDALHPYRIVLGVSDPRGERTLRALYAPFRTRLVVLPPAAAELVKYASNSLLALRVSSANEFSRMARAAGVDVYPVLEAVGMDPRIGPLFLRAGPGFGGSCFTKDVNALLAWARDRSLETPILNATLEGNELQARHVAEIAEAESRGLEGKRVALLGLAFKAGTSDTRDSRAYPITEALLRKGATVLLYDPHAMEGFRRGLSRNAAREIGSRLFFAKDLKGALGVADLAVIQADWEEFRKLRGKDWASLKDRLVVDARRSVDPKTLRRAGVRYAAVGDGNP